MSYRPNKPHDLFNDKAVSPLLTPALTAVMAGLTDKERGLVKRSCTQGWSAGSSAYSGDTHNDGCAVDFVTRTWPKSLIKKVVQLFQQNGCQAVLRVVGEDLGVPQKVSVEHVHAILDGHGNAALLKSVTGPKGHRHIDKELAKITYK